MDFLETVEANACKYRDKLLFSDGVDSLTYGETYELSGRVYAYLKNKGIGNEDFVLVRLKRGPMPMACMLGVLRAGAAFVAMEDDIPAERCEFIRIDCGCRLMIDDACMAEVLKTEPISGFEARDAHSAVFAVYTSGTTGRPKGVLHEYGNIDRIVRSNPFRFEEDRLALCSPLNFVFSVVSFIDFMYCAQECYVVPFAVVKDPAGFHEFLLTHKITLAFLTPQFVQKMAPLLMTLKTCSVGSEPANDLFAAGLSLLNGYTMSEVGYIVAVFPIDRRYANTPVGKSPCGFPIYVMDENGNEVPDGEKGEVVLDNPYVRGYINLPEKTAEVFKNGLYHTGDLGMLNKDHDLVICGRIDDMDKVNGNRIEPAEIEAVAREILGLSWAAARVFHNDGSPVVCLYYTDDKEIDTEEARKQLAEKLPYYMLPAFFMHIDRIPMTMAGKFDRKGLPVPDLDSNRAPYRAPENDIECAICKAFEKVFNVNKAGLDDDFYGLGGDSLNAIGIVVDSGLDGLTVAEVLSGRTPAGIAALNKAHEKEGNPDKINEAALKEDFLLTPNQEYTVIWQLKEPDSVMRNNPAILKFDRTRIDMSRMASAIGTTIRNHPALMTEIYYGKDGELRQRFSPDLIKDVQVEELTDEEFEKVKSTLVKPFSLINDPLIRVRVFETKTAGYVFADVHHTVLDGSSFDILLSDIMSAYLGKELSKDYYPYILKTKFIQRGSSDYELHKAYFDQKYGNKDWCRHISAIGDAIDSPVGVIKEQLPVTVSRLAGIEKIRGISKNGFFAIAAARAIAKCEGKTDVMLFWTFNGRTDVKELHSLGDLRCSLPIAFSFADGVSFEDICKDVNEQISGGMAHCRYPYLEMHNEFLDDGITRVLYQGTMGAAPNIPGFLGIDRLRTINMVSRTFVNLEIIEKDDDAILILKYTEKSFDSEKMELLVKYLEDAVKEMSLANSR